MNGIKYVRGRDGRKYEIDFFCVIENGKTTYYVDNVLHTTRVYWRSERTWDDHMGNTPCGYYVIVPLPSGERKRVYIYS